ncbi:unnamed protein product [Ixodes pacificus]
MQLRILRTMKQKHSIRTASLMPASFWKYQRGERILLTMQDIDSGLKDQIAKNRECLTPVITTVVWCGRQGVALRGHRDAGKMDLSNEQGENEANFKALLRLRASNGDELFKKHLEGCSANATYPSWRTQNEIISACNSIVLQKACLEGECCKVLCSHG